MNIASKIDTMLILFAFLVAVIATAGSLFYSEVIGFTPCKLCWFQRVTTYPLIIILGVGILDINYSENSPKLVYIYAIILSGISTTVALYHSYIQLAAESGVCSSGCSVVIYRAFGILSIPNQSLIANSIILITCVAGLIYTTKYREN